MNYLEIPVLGKVSFSGKKAKVWVNAGPSVAYSFGGIAKTELSPGGPAIKYSSTIKFSYKEPDGKTVYLNSRIYRPYDLGMQFGLGGSLQVGLGAFLADARCGLGLTYFYQDNGPNLKKGQRSKSIFLTIGYSIPFTKFQ